MVKNLKNQIKDYNVQMKDLKKKNKEAFEKMASKKETLEFRKELGKANNLLKIKSDAPKPKKKKKLNKKMLVAGAGLVGIVTGLSVPLANANNENDELLAKILKAQKTIAEKDTTIAEKDTTIAEKDTTIAEKDTTIETLREIQKGNIEELSSQHKIKETSLKRSKKIFDYAIKFDKVTFHFSNRTSTMIKVWNPWMQNLFLENELLKITIYSKFAKTTLWENGVWMKNEKVQAILWDNGYEDAENGKPRNEFLNGNPLQLNGVLKGNYYTGYEEGLRASATTPAAENYPEGSE